MGHGGSSSCRLANIFLDFFLAVFSGYRSFVKRRDGYYHFDAEALRGSQRKTMVPFNPNPQLPNLERPRA